MMIYCIIPTFNRYECLVKLLEQITSQSKSNLRFVIVDESTVKTPDEIKHLVSKSSIYHLAIGDNGLYWTGCINLGINYTFKNFNVSIDDYILLLNDDIILADNFFDQISNLCTRLGNDVAFGATVLDSITGNLVDGGNKINKWTAKKRKISHTEEDKYYPDVLTGRGVVYPVKIIKDVGLFRFPKFKQCGDWDYSALVKKKGYKLIIYKQLKVYLHLNETFAINRVEKLKWKDIGKIFFNVRSNFNLKYRYHVAMSLTSNRIHGVWFFILDIFRIASNFI